MNEIIFEKNGKKYMIFEGKILEYHKQVEDFDKDAYEKETEYRVRIFRKQKEQAKQPTNISRKYVYKDQKTGNNIYLDSTQVSQMDINLEEERLKKVKKILKKKDKELREEYEKTHPKNEEEAPEKGLFSFMFIFLAKISAARAVFDRPFKVTIK